MSLVVTPLYAGLLTLVYLALTARVIVYRRGNRISMGDSGDTTLAKRIRVHSNLIEYVPLALLLMLMAEVQGAPHVAVHLLGLGLLAGRLSHAIGVSRTPQSMTLRTIGMVLTLTVLLFAALGLIGHSLL